MLNELPRAAALCFQQNCCQPGDLPAASGLDSQSVLWEGWQAALRGKQPNLLTSHHVRLRAGHPAVLQAQLCSRANEDKEVNVQADARKSRRAQLRLQIHHMWDLSQP